MKIYISGKITGTTDYMERFENAEDYLNKTFPGCEIINPALINSYLPKSTTHKQYMSMSLTMLNMADTIFMMNGWSKSDGANMEFDYAVANRKTIMFEGV